MMLLATRLQYVPKGLCVETVRHVNAYGKLIIDSGGRSSGRHLANVFALGSGYSADRSALQRRFAIEPPALHRRCDI